MEPLLEARGVLKTFAGGGDRKVHALKGVSLQVGTGESVGLVGETGSGKTTLAKALLGLTPVDGGEVRVRGLAIAAMTAAERKRFRRGVQMVFQQPLASLDPHFAVREILMEPLAVHGLPSAEREGRVRRTLESVGLLPEVLAKLPGQLSGGQRQRVAIARALVLEPACLVLDEPVSALDLSVQAQVLHLLAALRRERGLTYLLVSHDMGVVEFLCDRVAVMYHGVVVEEATVRGLLDGPLHPYTRRLLAARLPSSPPEAPVPAVEEEEPLPAWDRQPVLAEAGPGHRVAPAAGGGG
jgi:ABC-type glutathione transport system ATPase component